MVPAPQEKVPARDAAKGHAEAIALLQRAMHPPRPRDKERDAVQVKAADRNSAEESAEKEQARKTALRKERHNARRR